MKYKSGDVFYNTNNKIELWILGIDRSVDPYKYIVRFTGIDIGTVNMSEINIKNDISIDYEEIGWIKKENPNEILKEIL